MASRNVRKEMQIMSSYDKIIPGKKKAAMPRKEDTYGVLGYL